MAGFKTEWTVSGDATARTITLPLYNSGTFNCTVTWGDGSADSTITAYNDADRIHTYASNGTYEVTIVGECPAWSFNNGGDKLKCTDILDWGSASAPAGPTFAYLTGGFYGCTNLKSYGVSGKIRPKAGLTLLRELFYNCAIPTEIPTGLFDLCTGLTANAFNRCFEQCRSIQHIPQHLFKYNVNVSTDAFLVTFYCCYALLDIPQDIFRYNTLVSGAGFENTFRLCSITQLPVDIFRYNSLVGSAAFNFCFYETKLTSLPNDVFKYNVNVSSNGFKSTFEGSLLESVPSLLFKYNTSCTSFNSTFKNCNKLQQNATIFYAAGEQATRFAGKTVDFTDCFARNSNTGVQGVAPDLWNCTMTACTKTGCWGGNGNNYASLSNATDVPTTWGINLGFMIKVTVAGDTTARTFTSPFPNNGTYNGTIDWGDGTAVSAITSYNDADGIHVYAANGTYLINFYGEIPSFSFNNGGDKLKIVDIIQWGKATIHGGFGYLDNGFYGCTNLVSTGVGKVLSKSGLTKFYQCFRGCTSLTTITSGLFDNCTYLTASGFDTAFYGCTSLTTIPTDLFKYNTGITSSGFIYAFYGCTSLASIPTDLFRYNTAVSTLGFDSTFFGCTLLSTVPELLFKYNTLAVNFTSCFEGCIKLQQNAKIFFDTGEEATRFAGKTVDFTRCFYRNSFTGTQGVAPALWDCTMTASTKTNCWAGSGNSLTSLTNYESIPVVWGHVGGFRTEWTVAGNVTARTITLPLIGSGFNCIVSWGDGTPDSTIDYYLSANRIHTYASNGTYEVSITGECPGWSFYEQVDKLKLTDIIDWGAIADFGGFSYLSWGFTGCTNLKTTGVGKILSKSTLTDLGYLFENCTSITAITSGMFDNCTYLTVSGLGGTFWGCTGLTSIPTDIFKYNTAVSSSGFYGTFYGCTSLTTVPTDTFKYNTAVSIWGFNQTFFGCTLLATVPELLFKYNTLAIVFTSCFEGCIKLQQNAKIFFDTGEEATRFAGKTVVFTRCFYRDSFTGTLGIAPALWDCTMTASTKTDCWSGDGNSVASLTNYNSIPIAWGGTYILGFKTEWIVSGNNVARTITLPLYDSGTFNCIVDWGDGTTNKTITSYNDVNRIHTYFFDGTYEVSITGECPGWSFNNGGDKLKCTDIIDWGNNADFGGFSYLTNGFKGCTNLKTTGAGRIQPKATLTNLESLFENCTSLTAITSAVFYDCTYLTTYGFKYTFSGCTGITSTTTDIFKYNTSVSSYGFDSTFYGCTALTIISTDLFKYNTAVSSYGFYNTFNGCTSLASIPASIFRYNTAVSSGGFYGTFSGCTSLNSISSNLFIYNASLSSYGFLSTFYNCTALTSIPTDLFRYNTAVSTYGFDSTFYGCTALTTVPTDTFRYNTAVSGFTDTFYNCTSLASIPTDLFRYNTSSLSFHSTFFGCTLLATVPELLFKYNTLAIVFTSCFEGCIKLQQNAKIFFDTGEEATRFAGKTVYFTDCFYRTSFTGTIGVAPALWSCTFSEVTKTRCWSGVGNSLASLTNYNSIPIVWGGKFVSDGIKFQFTVAGDVTARTITLPLIDAGIDSFNCIVDWGDGTANSTITSYNDADRIHTYALDGTYEVHIAGECASWSFDNGGDKLKLTRIVSLAGDGFEGFHYLVSGFEGCANLTSIVGSTIKLKSSCTILGHLFRNCTSLNAVPELFFQTSTNVTSFLGCFEGCIKLQQNAKIFFDTGEESTRFAGITEYIDFTRCFYRTGFTGTIGVAPALWDCTFGAVPIKIDCWAGDGNSVASLTNYNLIPLAWGGTFVNGFRTQWTVSGNAAARTITLPLYNSGTFNCRVDWGDGTAKSAITSYIDVDRIHTYASNGTYEVNISGECPSWSFTTADKLKLTDIIHWGNNADFGGFSYLTNGFYGCTNLVSTGAGKILSKSTLTNLGSLFYNCTSITTITSGLFDNCTYLTSSGFDSAFYGCTALTTVPTDIFKYNTAVSTSGFLSTFYNCTALTSIPTDLFRYNIAVSTSGFNQTFYGCTALTTVPTDTFKYNTAVSTAGFQSTFFGCTLLATVPELLFKYNTLAVDFTSCFEGCIKLQQNAKMFYDTGEEATRFAGQTVDFTRCFYRSSFTGTRGTAPNLWNCTMTASTKTNCWSGAGNSLTSLTNYNSIPIEWGGTYIISGITLEFTVAGDVTARTITLPLYNSGVFNSSVSWGDGTPDSIITTYNDADRIHTYAVDGTYEVGIYGALPSFSFNNSGDKLKLTGIFNLSGADFEGFEYLTNAFYGCVNLTSLGTSVIKAKAALTTVSGLFNNCTSLTTIPSGFFNSATNIAAGGFKDTFKNCTALTTIPTDLFRYNTAVSTAGFQSTFYGCTSLDTIITDLFKYNTAVSTSGFQSTFYGCTSLTSIPTDLFRYNTAVSTSGFQYTFYGCTSLSSVAIPIDLFRYNTAVSTSGFRQTFRFCTSLISIPTDTFRYNTAVSTSGFDTCFYECTALTTIPTDLFRYNTAVNGFTNTFKSCSALATVPELLFKYNTLAVDFTSCFEGCIKLQQNAKMFYDTGEEATRFAGQTIDFTRCFYRSSFTGTIGTAPDLWNLTYGARTPTQCWSGSGNSLASLTNYNSIPIEWGGTYVPLAYDLTNTSSVSSFAFGSWEWYQAITESNSISIEFICLVAETLERTGYYLSSADNTFIIGKIEGGSILTCGSYANNTWHKIKVERLASGIFKLYVNDILVGTSAVDLSTVNSHYITMMIGENCRVSLSDPLGNHSFKISLIS